MNENTKIQSDLRPTLLYLLEAGMKQAEIARAVGLSRASINFAVKKTDGSWMPGYDVGRRLVELATKTRASTIKSKEAEHA